MDIDANGILRVDAEEARSGAKASFTIVSDQQSPKICQIFYIMIYNYLGLTKDDIEQHIAYVTSDENFRAKSGQC